MNLPIDIDFLAEGDVIEHAAYLGRSNPEMGLRFIRAARATYEDLAEFPGVGSFYELDDPSIPALRKWPVRGFKSYLVFYRDDGHRLSIRRVLHSSRDIPSILRRMRGEP